MGRTRFVGIAQGIGFGLAVLVGGVTPVLGQAQPVVGTRQTGHPQRDTLQKMMRPISIDFQEQRLEDVMRFIAEVSGADVKPLYVDDRNAEGLDPDELITLSVKDVTMLDLLDQILLELSDEFEQATWQMTSRGTMQVSMKARLNKYKRVEIYDINDLLLILPTYDEVPEIDLQSVLQSSQGGGGQSPFDDDDDDDFEVIPLEERATEVIDIIITLAEPNSWIDNGAANGASIRYWQGALIVNGPDYVHRAVNGYPWWPSRAAGSAAGGAGGGRYVSMSVDTGLSRITDFAEQEVTAVVGGELVSSNPGGGG